MIGQITAVFLVARIFFKGNRNFIALVNLKKIIALAKKYKNFPKYNAPHALMNSASLNMPVFIISYFFSSGSTGFFTLANRVLLSPISVFTYSYGQVFLQGLTHNKNKKENEVVIVLPSKKQKIFHPECRATIGTIAGSGRKEKPFLKAGTKYHYMKARNKLYPKTSGIAMNAVDHPHGTSRSSKKGHPTIARKNAPPGAKVGKIRPRRTGYKR